MSEKTNLRCFMDEKSVPYDYQNDTYIPTEEDLEFEKMIIEKYHLYDEE